MVDRLEEVGEEMFEKNYLSQDGEILVSVFCIAGENAAEMSALVREWASSIGLKRSS